MNDSLTTNWADVAQQALEMGQSAVTEIVTAVKGIAPEVWEILMRQVYAEAITTLWTLGILLGISALLFILGLLMGDNFGEGVGVFSGVLFVFCLAGWMFAGIDAVRALMTPEYYAIQKFFAIASGGGL